MGMLSTFQKSEYPFDLSQTLWLLATDQETQHKLRAEVTPVLAANPRPDYKTLKDLQWLDCVV